MALLTCRNLSVGYPGRIVSENLNFTVQSGDALCIVGENGAGKSTLIKTLLGLLSPLAGRIETGDGLMPQDIGYLPQQSRLQKDFPASTDEVVLSGCLNRSGWRPFYCENEKKRALGAMEKLGIADLRRRCYRELSGGQQQRVLLARALCAAGKILVLDEPVAGLDPHAAAEMYDIIGRLNGEGLSIVMISHDTAAAVRFASHILHMGRSPLFFGTAADYLASNVGQTWLTMEGAKAHV